MATKIEWATEVYNPVTGCTPVSDGCKHCYARRMATRLRGRFGYPQDDPFKVTLHPDRVDQPLKWKKPRMIFVSSMGDLFHKDVPDEFIGDIGRIVTKCPQHSFVILTKRPERMRDYFKKVAYETAVNPPHESLNMLNVLLGVSVEDQETADKRIPILLQVPAAKRVVSYEPALSGLDMWEWLWETNPDYQPPRFLDEGETYTVSPYVPSNKIGWLICGGETGPGARPMNPVWARAVKDQCVAAGVPFFFKQTGPWIPDRLADPTEPNVRTVDGLRMILTSRKRHPIAAKLGKRLLEGQVWEQVPG